MGRDFEANFTEADEIIEQSRRLSERAKETRSHTADLFAPPKTPIVDPNADPIAAPPKRRWLKP